MSQSMSTSRRFGGRLAIVAAVAAAMLAVGVASASAAHISSVSPDPVLTPETVSVEGEEFGGYEAKDIKVGICTEGGYPFVPACGVFATNVEISGGGVMTASMFVTSPTFTNLHAKIPGQPPNFNCEEVACGVLVVNHPEGGAQTPIDFEALTIE